MAKKGGSKGNKQRKQKQKAQQSVRAQNQQPNSTTDASSGAANQHDTHLDAPVASEEPVLADQNGDTDTIVSAEPAVTVAVPVELAQRSDQAVLEHVMMTTTSLDAENSYTLEMEDAQQTHLVGQQGLFVANEDTPVLQNSETQLEEPAEQLVEQSVEKMEPLPSVEVTRVEALPQEDKAEEVPGQTVDNGTVEISKEEKNDMLTKTTENNTSESQAVNEEVEKHEVVSASPQKPTPEVRTEAEAESEPLSFDNSAATQLESMPWDDQPAVINTTEEIHQGHVDVALEAESEPMPWDNQPAGNASEETNQETVDVPVTQSDSMPWDNENVAESEPMPWDNQPVSSTAEKINQEALDVPSTHSESMPWDKEEASQSETMPWDNQLNSTATEETNQEPAAVIVAQADSELPWDKNQATAESDSMPRDDQPVSAPVSESRKDDTNQVEKLLDTVPEPTITFEEEITQINEDGDDSFFAKLSEEVQNDMAKDVESVFEAESPAAAIEESKFGFLEDDDSLMEDDSLVGIETVEDSPTLETPSNVTPAAPIIDESMFEFLEEDDELLDDIMDDDLLSDVDDPVVDMSVDSSVIYTPQEPQQQQKPHKHNPYQPQPQSQFQQLQPQQTFVPQTTQLQQNHAQSELHQRLAQEKKKSDAYDFPVDLLAKTKKRVPTATAMQNVYTQMEKNLQNHQQQQQQQPEQQQQHQFLPPPANQFQQPPVNQSPAKVNPYKPQSHQALQASPATSTNQFLPAPPNIGAVSHHGSRSNSVTKTSSFFAELPVKPKDQKKSSHIRNPYAAIEKSPMAQNSQLMVPPVQQQQQPQHHNAMKKNPYAPPPVQQLQQQQQLPMQPPVPQMNTTAMSSFSQAPPQQAGYSQNALGSSPSPYVPQQPPVVDQKQPVSSSIPPNRPKKHNPYAPTEGHIRRISQEPKPLEIPKPSIPPIATAGLQNHQQQPQQPPVNYLPSPVLNLGLQSPVNQYGNQQQGYTFPEPTSAGGSSGNKYAPTGQQQVPSNSMRRTTRVGRPSVSSINEVYGSNIVTSNATSTNYSSKRKSVMPPSGTLKSKHAGSNSITIAPAPVVINPENLTMRQWPLFDFSAENFMSMIPMPSTYGSTSTCLFKVETYKNILKDTSLADTFPGPLPKNKSKKKEISKWLDEKLARVCQGVTDPLLYSEEQLLWHVVKLIVDNITKKDDFTSNTEYLNALLTLLNPSLGIDNVGPTHSSDSFDIVSLRNVSMSINPPDAPNAHRLDANSLSNVHELLERGHKSSALEFALSKGDWTMALLIANFIGPTAFNEVLKLYTTVNYGDNHMSLDLNFFLQSSTVNGDFQSLQGKETWIVENFKTIIPFILKNKSNVSKPLFSIGESLIKSGYKVYGKIAILISGEPLVPSCNEMLPTSMDDMLIDEIYEHVLLCSENMAPQFTNGLPHMVPVKIRHAGYLADFGLVNEAHKYISSSQADIASKLLFVEPSTHIAQAQITGRLSKAGTTWLGGISRPKLDKVWTTLDKSFTKFVSGTTDENVEQPKEDDSIFAKFTSPSVSRIGSQLDLSQGGSVTDPTRNQLYTIHSVSNMQNVYGTQSRQLPVLQQQQQSAPPPSLNFQPVNPYASTTVQRSSIGGAGARKSKYAPPSNPVEGTTTDLQHTHFNGITPPLPIGSTAGPKKYSPRVPPIPLNETPGNPYGQTVLSAPNEPQHHVSAPPVLSSTPPVMASAVLSSGLGISSPPTGMSPPVPPPKKVSLYDPSTRDLKPANYAPAQNSYAAAMAVHQSPVKQPIVAQPPVAQHPIVQPPVVQPPSVQQMPPPTLPSEDVDPHTIISDAENVADLTNNSPPHDPLPICEPNDDGGDEQGNDILEEEVGLSVSSSNIETAATGNENEVDEDNEDQSVTPESVVSDEFIPTSKDILDEKKEIADEKIEEFHQKTEEETHQPELPSANGDDEIKNVVSATDSDTSISNTPVVRGPPKNMYAPLGTNKPKRKPVNPYANPYATTSSSSNSKPVKSMYAPKVSSASTTNEPNDDPLGVMNGGDFDMFQATGYRTVPPPVVITDSKPEPEQAEEENQGELQQDQPQPDQDIQPDEHSSAPKEIPMMHKPMQQPSFVPPMINIPQQQQQQQVSSPMPNHQLSDLNKPPLAIRDMFQPPPTMPVTEDSSSPRKSPIYTMTEEKKFYAEDTGEYYDDIVDDDDDDDEDSKAAAERARAEQLRLEQERKQKEEEERLQKQREQEEDKKKQTEGGSRSWFTLFGGRNKETEDKKVYKAKLGEASSFYYDEKLKRWINGKESLEDQLNAAKPPPPPPAAAAKISSQALPMGNSNGSTCGPSSVPPSVTPSVPPSGIASPLPPLGQNATPSLSHATSIDDLLNRASGSGTSTPGVGGAARKKRGPRRGYVDVMSQQQQ